MRADGEAYPVLREVDTLSGLLPDCAVCSRRTGDAVLVDRVSWKLRAGVYFVTAECHGEKETRRIRTSELEGVERILLLPAFRELSIVVSPRLPESPPGLVSLLLQVMRLGRRAT